MTRQEAVANEWQPEGGKERLDSQGFLAIELTRFGKNTKYICLKILELLGSCFLKPFFCLVFSFQTPLTFMLDLLILSYK